MKQGTKQHLLTFNQVENKMSIWQTDEEKLRISASHNGFEEMVWSEKYEMYFPKSKIEKIEKHWYQGW